MGAPDLTLSPGDILRGVVDHVDVAMDACFLDAGSHGRILVPLAGIAGGTVARLVPGAVVCAQVIEPPRGKVLARASVSIEFSGRTSVLMLDGTAITGAYSAAQPSVFVSKRISSMRRAELSTLLEAALADEASGLPSMLGAVCGPVNVVLRTAADEVPWNEVLSAVVVQVTEAAAFTVLARADSAPALLMAEKPDADGDSSISNVPGVSYTGPQDALDGRRVALACGAEVLFQRTEAMWAVAVRPCGATAPAGSSVAAVVNAEAAVAVAEAVTEYGLTGVVAVSFVRGMSFDAFNDVVDAVSAELGTSQTRISGDAALSVVLIDCGGRTIC